MNTTVRHQASTLLALARATVRDAPATFGLRYWVARCTANPLR